jgi:hypothetical protein
MGTQWPPGVLFPGVCADAKELAIKSRASSRKNFFVISLS